MRRFSAVVSATLLVATVVLGPWASAASAATTFSTGGFPCYARGTIEGGPSTTLSSVSVDFGTPGTSFLACYFRGTQLATSFGGACRYENANFRVDFRHRILFSLSSGARLLCSDGVITITVHTLTTIVSNFNGRDTRTFDLISYGTSQCTDQVEDGAAACTATIAAGTIVTVNLQDESFFTYTCPGGSEQNSSGTGPFTGQCLVTMDADKSISVLGDAAT